MEKLGRTKINMIRKYYITGGVKGITIARELGIQPETVAKYFKEFREIERLYPRRLKDFRFLLPKVRRQPESPYYRELMSVLPGLVEKSASPYLAKIKLWKAYRLLYPKGCSINFFYGYFNDWQKKHNICKYYHRHINHVPAADKEELTRWRNSGDTELWRKAVVILDSLKKRPVAEMSAQIEVSLESILKWLAAYKEKGMAGIRRKPFIDPKKEKNNQLKRENIYKLVQQTPKLHGLNRTSWSLVALSAIYTKVYGNPLSTHAIGHHLIKMGYRFQKSRERLTSPDKDYQVKMDKIKGILSALKPDERFFSIDEYGPAAVKMKTGWSYTKAGEIKTVPQLQKGKGGFILTAAVELSSNQVTHFFFADEE